MEVEDHDHALACFDVSKPFRIFFVDNQCPLHVGDTPVTSKASSAPAVPAKSSRGSAGSSPLRKDTTVRRLKAPTMMKTHSKTREVTYPRAKISCCRLTIGYSTTAVPILAMQVMNSKSAPKATPVSAPAPTM